MEKPLPNGVESAGLEPARHLAAYGWSPAEPLLGAGEARLLLETGSAIQSRLSQPQDWRRGVEPDFARRPWFKSLHAVSAAWFDLGHHPTIVSRVSAVLGKDVLLWGSALITRHPGQVHRWHVDVEHMAWPGVSVFIGLEGVQPGLSGLKFIRHSHRFATGPATSISDELALALARQAEPRCALDYPPITDNEFLLFSGRIWHGSVNRSTTVRHAAILQYSVPSSRTAIPLNFDPPITWSRHAPPCVLVAGSDRYAVNHLVERPSGPGSA
ncbi:MAG: phytanoyl-CoA dioxygenase family protein [Sphingomicrobium sp.]